MEINSLLLLKFAFSTLLLLSAINITLNDFRYSPRYSKTLKINKSISTIFVPHFGKISNRSTIKLKSTPSQLKSTPSQLKSTSSKPSSYEVNKTSVIERRFALTRDEVLLTKVVTIDAKPCNSGQSLAVFIYSSAQSSGVYFEKRQFLRNAWIRQLKDRNVSVYFLIGLNSDPIVNQELLSEADKYSDLIQFGFIDHYYNLTLKSISMLRWIQSKCQTIAYTLKTDDDVMINVENLLNRLNEFESGITGKLWQKSKPIRDPKR